MIELSNVNDIDLEQRKQTEPNFDQIWLNLLVEETNKSRPTATPKPNPKEAADRTGKAKKSIDEKREEILQNT